MKNILYITKRTFGELAGLLSDPGEIWALLTWPKFSFTSYHVVKALKERGICPGTVIDIGANVGQFAVAAARFFPGTEIHSFEPVEETVRRLIKNTAAEKRITAHQTAIGERSGEAEIYINSDSRATSILPLAKAHLEAFPHAVETKKSTVKISTLDGIFSQIDLPRPVLIKIDVEGYEWQVISGGGETFKKADHIVIEMSMKVMHEGEKKFGDISDRLRDKGFIFIEALGRLAAPASGETLQIDALFGRDRAPTCNG